MTTTKFFVYGSMSEGLVHFSKIQEFIVNSIPASIQATAYRLKVGYPALLNEKKDFVKGQLIEVNASDILLGLLDEFFGYNRQNEKISLYSRCEVPVYFAEQDLVKSEFELQKAWVYFLNPEKLPTSATLIEGGDWKDSLVKNPALTEQLTEKQRHYIQKLGKSSAREIVPIDLTMYRELMKLELIVDKGRRLALSKLGHEVFRHLG